MGGHICISSALPAGIHARRAWEPPSASPLHSNTHCFLTVLTPAGLLKENGPYYGSKLRVFFFFFFKWNVLMRVYVADIHDSWPSATMLSSDTGAEARAAGCWARPSLPFMALWRHMLDTEKKPFSIRVELTLTGYVPKAFPSYHSWRWWLFHLKLSRGIDLGQEKSRALWIGTTLVNPVWRRMSAVSKLQCAENRLKHVHLTCPQFFVCLFVLITCPVQEFQRAELWSECFVVPNTFALPRGAL